MTGRIAAIFRHPVKGFTPERIDRAELTAGRNFPADRIYAVENGPSGFDPDQPEFIPKQKFTVLAAIPEVARARTAYDPERGVLRAEAPGQAPFEGALDEPAGRDAFAAWLTVLLGEAARGPLKVLPAGGGHAFMDHPLGHVSVINLASVRDLEARLGRPLDPLRFRANLYVEGWPAWAELDWTGRGIALGPVQGRVFKSIVRCAATHVDPTTAVRDVEVTKALFDHYGHMNCGLYVHVTAGGVVSVGDPCPQAQDAPA